MAKAVLPPESIQRLLACLDRIKTPSSSFSSGSSQPSSPARGQVLKTRKQALSQLYDYIEGSAENALIQIGSKHMPTFSILCQALRDCEPVLTLQILSILELLLCKIPKNQKSFLRIEDSLSLLLDVIENADLYAETSEKAELLHKVTRILSSILEHHVSSRQQFFDAAGSDAITTVLEYSLSLLHSYASRYPKRHRSATKFSSSASSSSASAVLSSHQITVLLSCIQSTCSLIIHACSCTRRFQEALDASDAIEDLKNVFSFIFTQYLKSMQLQYAAASQDGEDESSSSIDRCASNNQLCSSAPSSPSISSSSSPAPSSLPSQDSPSSSSSRSFSSPSSSSLLSSPELMPSHSQSSLSSSHHRSTSSQAFFMQSLMTILGDVLLAMEAMTCRNKKLQSTWLSSTSDSSESSSLSSSVSSSSSSVSEHSGAKGESEEEEDLDAAGLTSRPILIDVFQLMIWAVSNNDALYLSCVHFLASLKYDNDRAKEIIREHCAIPGCDPSPLAKFSSVYETFVDECSSMRVNHFDSDQIVESLKTISKALSLSAESQFIFLHVHGALDLLIQCLNNIDESIMLHACKATFCFLWGNRLSQEAFLSLGGLNFLADCLRDYNPQIRLTSLQILSLLACDHPSCRFEMLSSGLIRHVISVLQEDSFPFSDVSSLHVFEAALGVLGHCVVGCPPIQEYLREAGALKLLSHTLAECCNVFSSSSSSSSSSLSEAIQQKKRHAVQLLLESVCLALNNSVFGNAKNQDALRTVGALDTCITLLSHHRSDMIKYFGEVAETAILSLLNVLINSVDTNQENQMHLNRPEVVSLIESLLSSPSSAAVGSEMVSLGCLLLSHLAWNSQENKELFGTKTIISRLLHILQSPASPPSSPSSSDEQHQQQLVHPVGRLPASPKSLHFSTRNHAAMLLDTDNECILVALSALINLSHLHASVQSSIRSQGGLPLILQFVTSSFPQLSRSAVFCLSNLVSSNNSENSQALLEVGGVEALVSVLNDQDDDETSNRAFSTLTSMGILAVTRILSALQDIIASSASDATVFVNVLSLKRIIQWLSSFNGLLYASDDNQAAVQESATLDLMIAFIDRAVERIESNHLSFAAVEEGGVEEDGTEELIFIADLCLVSLTNLITGLSSPSAALQSTIDSLPTRLQNSQLFDSAHYSLSQESIRSSLYSLFETILLQDKVSSYERHLAALFPSSPASSPRSDCQLWNIIRHDCCHPESEAFESAASFLLATLDRVEDKNPRAIISASLANPSQLLEMLQVLHSHILSEDATLAAVCQSTLHKLGSSFGQ